ncbi:MAG: C10 family peptidase, partial [Bacteroidales bacterium]|nr:C10 family peptidase [Bacteroidales bacterium]
TSKWGQGKYYNYYCPKDDAGTNKRAVTGCVATAMAQLLYYFRYPQTGIDTHSYEHPLYGTLSADFGATNYDYQAMEAQPNRINLPASLLTSHCGIAANMNYGAAASAAWSEDAANALINNFGYSPETQLIHRWEADNWDSLIVSHLDRRIPLYFAGTDTTKWVGHAFVCDAYQVDTNDNYFYHFNFGWEGYQDGYFYINPLLGESIAYHYGQDIIINAYPDTAKFDYPSQSPLTGTTILIEETGSFTDGIDDCPPNMDYTWIIRPDIDAITYIKLSLNYQLAEGDSLFITSLNGNVNHIFTYDTSSFLDNIADQEIIIRLKTTNDSIPSGGITASYTAEYGMFCKKGIDKYSLKTGSFGDGSKESRYRNNTDCIYWIEVAGVHSITIRFTTFETEKDRDILSIRDRAMGSVPLLMELSGNYTDSVYTFNTNSLIFDFITDDINVFQGWELTYETDVPIEDPKNINTFDGDNHCYIYPNPATNHLYVSVDDLLQDGQIHLFDVYGRLLLKHVIREKESQVNLNALAPGMYIVKVMDGERLYTVKRIIKE